MNREQIQQRFHQPVRNWLVIIMLTLQPALLWADEFKVRRVEIWLEDGAYELDVSIDYRFTGPVLEALTHGIPLTLEVHVQARRKEAWFWEKDIVDLKRYRVLRYHALTGLYEVSNLNHGKSQSFATRDAAISSLGEVLMRSVVRQDQFQAGEKYLLELRTHLDIESLPLTLRPQAYLDPDWNLSSKWNSWPL